MSDETRAAAYRAQKAKRAAFRAAALKKLAGQAVPAAIVRANFKPLLEATRHEQPEREEKRPEGIVNG